MEMINAKLLIGEAREKLAGKDVRRMAAIHAGVTVAAALVSTVLQYVLAEGIGNTSGLSGMGTRSVLETLQTVLKWANMVLLPFWNLGFLYVAMQWARGNDPRREDLLTGFHRVGPCLGLLLNRALITIAVVVLCVNVSSVVYMMTPAASGLLELAGTYGNTEELYDYLYSMDQTQTMELFRSMIPMLVVCVLLSALLLIPLLYRFRLAEYAVLDQKGLRAFPAMLVSAALLRRRCWQLFKVDLQLWWYYGLKLLCMLLLYADLLLVALGITLPVAGDMAYMTTYLLYLAALFAVETLFRPRVETAYAGFYDALMELGPAQKRTEPAKPQNMPWDDTHE